MTTHTKASETLGADPALTLRFVDCELDLARRELRRAGAVVELPPTPLRLLLYLAEHRDRTVPRQELLDAVWPEVVVGDDVVTRALSEARRAVGDDGDAQRVIRTLKGRGVRFVAECAELPNGAPVSGASAGGWSKPNPRSWAAPFAVLASTAIAAAALVSWRAHQPEGLASASVSKEALPNSVAVLPLSSFMNDPEQEFFVDGMHDALITNLARISALHVISRSSVMGYRETTKSSSEIGDELNVRALVEGSVFRTGNRVRISVQLIEAATDRHLWAESYEREVRDVLLLQREVARAIARQVGARVTPAEVAQLASTEAVDPETYDAFLKGLFHAAIYQRGGGSLASLRRSIEYHQEAVQRDPGWALGHAGLASAYHWLAGESGVEDDEELWRMAKASARRALELDEGLAHAHESLGYVLNNYDWDWNGAEREFRRALELDPSRRWGYALFLLSAARYDEAIENFRSIESRDPNSLIVMTQLGVACSCADRWDEAITQLQRVVELEPRFSFGHVALGYAYLGKSMVEEAVSEAEIATRLQGDAVLPRLPHLGYMYARAGREAEAQAILQQIEGTAHGYLDGLPDLYVALHQKGKALTLYETALAKRDRRLLLLRCTPEYDRVRDDPRFQEVLRRISFP